MTATPPAGRANHMGISLIVTKSIDREYNETGDAILKQEWMAFVSLNDRISGLQPPRPTPRACIAIVRRG